jgi:type I restriction enzyme, S subunit
METVRVPINLLTDRLDVRYNSRAAVFSRETIATCGLPSAKVGSLFKSLVCGPFGSTLTADEHSEAGEVLLVQPTNISSELFSSDSSWKIKEKTRQDKNLPLYPAKSFLFARVGVYPHVGVLPEWVGDATISSSMIAGLPSGKVDSYYLLAFFRCCFGSPLLFAAQKVTAQPTIGTYEIAETEVILPHPKIQVYIGDKVRQAERLRDRSRELDINAKDKVSEYFDCFKASPRRKIYSTEAQCITGRIDSWSYNPRFLEAVAAIKNSGSTLIDLEKITKKITNGATPKGATFSNQGIPWIRGKDFSNGDIIAESLPMMDIYSESTMKRSRLEYGDLLLSIKGTVGDVAVVDESLVGFNINQDVARIQLGSIEEAHFLALFLESSLGQVLIEQQVYGAINPFFSLENLRAFLVPDPNSIDRVYKSLVVGLRSKSVIYRRFSNWLTVAAKLLVEALIEGKLSESDLKAAQEGLEKGDTTLDREILARLTRKGIDFPNEAPLFPDLDALYNALTSLNETETIEAANPGNGQVAKVYHLHGTPLALASEAPETSYAKPKEVPE